VNFREEAARYHDQTGGKFSRFESGDAHFRRSMGQNIMKLNPVCQENCGDGYYMYLYFRTSRISEKKEKNYFLAASVILFVLVTNGVILHRGSCRLVSWNHYISIKFTKTQI
jgi:hypothetical protein